MESLKLSLGLTFDDILLFPGFSDLSRTEINLSTRLTKKITLSIPFVSAPMDTVTESGLAIALAKLGGIGIIHRNLTVSEQAAEVKKVKKQKLLVGGAISASSGFEKRVEELIKAGVDVIVIDSAHGFSRTVMETTSYIKNKYPEMQVIAGNVATYDGAKALINCGADAIRVGMGPGAICTTRIISGMGVPQVTAIVEVVRAARLSSLEQAVPVIADGGIKYSGDMVKALAVGASTVMMGGFFASALESPGEVMELRKDQVPHRFQSIFNHTHVTYKFKSYRGMGSVGAMDKGVKIKSEGEFHGKDYKEKVLVAEGVEGLVPIKGTTQELVDQAVGGIKSGMYYVGAKTIEQLWKKASFMQITHASLAESHPHDILVTNPGKNYL